MRNQVRSMPVRLALVALLALPATPAIADEGKGEKVSGDFVTSDKTFIDFTETVIDGKMKAPQGFFLQGRQSQALKQMVRLRSKFRSELRNSKAAVKSLVK